MSLVVYHPNQNRFKKRTKLYISYFHCYNLQESTLNLLKFNYSKARTMSQTCPYEKNLSSSPEHNYFRIYCLQCNQQWHSCFVQFLSKDLVKYTKYLIHCSYLFYVVKGISSNKTINSRLNTIIPTSNVNIKKDKIQGMAQTKQ